jgi:predicted phage terminase large subunit-like protein
MSAMNLSEILAGLSPAMIQRELARRSLLDYAQYQMPDYRIGKHHEIIAGVLESVEAGRLKRVMIFAPPRHGKSCLTSEFFPAWYLGRNPNKQIIHATYSQELADSFGRKVRNQIADKQEFPFEDCVLSGDSASQKKFATTREGVYVAVGVGGSATGKGSHLLLIDDPLKGREEADSKTIREKLKDWYKSVAYTRLMPGGAIVILMTRWHDDDLAGWLLREHSEEKFVVINLPAICEDTKDGTGRKIGEALWESDFPLERLEAIKSQLGSREWSALYQQRPTPDSGSVFNIDWFRRYNLLPDTKSASIHSWDTGTKDSEIHDPSVMTCWRCLEDGFYLEDLFQDRLQFPELRRAVQLLAERDNPSAILIEDKGSGQQLIQVLQNETRLPVIAVPATVSKIARAVGVSGYIEAGKVYIPKEAKWMVDFETQIRAFPAGAHDDIIDSITQAIRYLIDNQNRLTPRRESSSIDYYRRFIHEAGSM